MERGSSEEHELKDPKIKKKTPLQIEMLEKAYAENNHPSKAVRAELSAKLGLTNRQMQMWFCNRRLKDRKGNKDELETNFTQAKDVEHSLPKEPPSFYEFPAAVLASEVEDDALFGTKAWQQAVQESQEHCMDFGHKRRKAEKDSLKSSEKRRQAESDFDTQAVAIAIMSAWGESFREDGPILGFDFDPLPPGAFDLPTEPVRYSSSVSAVEHTKGVPVRCRNGSTANYLNGTFCADLKSAVEHLPRDQQSVLATRELGAHLKPGAISMVGQIKPSGLKHIQLQHMPRTSFDHHAGLHHSRRSQSDPQNVQVTLKRPSKLVPSSRETLCPPKRLLPPSMKAFMKHDGYGFEDQSENGGELSLFPARGIRDDLRLALMN